MGLGYQRCLEKQLSGGGGRGQEWFGYRVPWKVGSQLSRRLVATERGGT